MIVIAFHGTDQDPRAANEARDVAKHARVVCRNGDAFTGWIERTLGREDVVAIHAPGHPHIVAAYAAAGIPHLEMPTDPVPVADDAPVVLLDDEKPTAKKRGR